MIGADFKIDKFSEFTYELDCINKNSLVLFRGQPNDDLLLPKIARKNPLVDTTQIEKSMLKDFKRRCSERHTNNLHDDRHYLALAQHHGMETRLLDWSANPLIALWFACISENVKESHSVVWAFLAKDDTLLELKGTDPFDNKSTKVLQPNLVGRRIISQLGYFTAHKFSKRSTSHGFIPLQNNPEYDLVKIRIRKTIRYRLIQVLNTCGINSSTIFPDLDGLSRHINWTYIK